MRIILAAFWVYSPIPASSLVSVNYRVVRSGPDPMEVLGLVHSDTLSGPRLNQKIPGLLTPGQMHFQ